MQNQAFSYYFYVPLHIPQYFTIFFILFAKHFLVMKMLVCHKKYFIQKLIKYMTNCK